MNRRDFFKNVGLGAAAGILAPVLGEADAAPEAGITMYEDFRIWPSGTSYSLDGLYFLEIECSRISPSSYSFWRLLVMKINAHSVWGIPKHRMLLLAADYEMQKTAVKGWWHYTPRMKLSFAVRNNGTFDYQFYEQADYGLWLRNLDIKSINYDLGRRTANVVTTTKTTLTEKTFTTKDAKGAKECLEIDNEN